MSFSITGPELPPNDPLWKIGCENCKTLESERDQLKVELENMKTNTVSVTFHLREVESFRFVLQECVEAMEKIALRNRHDYINAEETEHSDSCAPCVIEPILAKVRKAVEGK